MNPQQLLHQFDAAVERAEALRKLQIGRPSHSTVACIIKLISGKPSISSWRPTWRWRSLAG